MIKTVIKNNGQKEDFMPEKLNRLGEWAANNNVEW